MNKREKVKRVVEVNLEEMYPPHPSQPTRAGSGEYALTGNITRLFSGE